MPDAGVVATIMLLLGLFLLGLEFFIPSFGMILILSLISLAVSFWAACKAWYGVSPVFFWSYVFVAGVGVPGSLLGAVWLMQRTSLGSRIILQGPQLPQKVKNPLEDLVGLHGESQSMMAPGGIVLVDNQRYHAESIGMIIDPQTAIVVVDVKGNRLVVRPHTPSDEKRVFESSAGKAQQQQAATAETVIGGSELAAEGKGEKTDHLDFEIPDD
jgi:membrane-bound ClpP family serine protease